MLSANVLVFLVLLLAGASVVGLIAVRAIRRRLDELELSVQRLTWNLRDLKSESASAERTAASVHEPTLEFSPPASSTHQPLREARPPEAFPQSRAGPGEPTATRTAIPGQPIDVDRPAPPRRYETTLESIEKQVGARWLNWAGALVVLVGIAFLLKFLYDRGWIGPAGRVGVGLAFGVGLLFLAETRLRRVHELLSQSVSAAGCGALFLTTFLAFKFYDFSGRLPTFMLLCWFAAFTVTLAVIRNGRVLAFLGLLGAYLTPYLLSTGEDQAESLFSYLALLAFAGAFVSAARGWSRVPSLCVVLTWLYFAGWYARFASPERVQVATVGAAGLVLLLGAACLARGLWRRSEVHIEECVTLLGSVVAGLAYLWQLLAAKHPAVLGFVLCGMALVCLAGLQAARTRRASPALLESTLLGLAAGSLLLVIPACLEASGAMIAWALAAVVLTDIASASRRRVLELAAAASLVATLVVGLSEPVRHTGVFHPVANRVFVAWLAAIAAWFVAGMRCTRAYRGVAGRRMAGPALQAAACFMMLGLLSYEAVAWFAGRLSLPGADVNSLKDWRTVTLCLLWALYPAVWMRRAEVQPRLRDLAAAHYAATGIGLLALLRGFHHREVLLFLNPVFAAALLFPAGVFLASRSKEEGRRTLRRALQTYGHVLLVTLLSVELYQGLFLPAEYAASRHWIRMAMISAAWALYATVVLVMGIVRNVPAWRWLALVLLGITLLKVFLVDMAAVRQIWRVMSFLVLGGLLMACSYAYSRLERKLKSETEPYEKEVSP